jgi:hypothetical protein
VSRWDRLAVDNYRGIRVPRTIGLLLLAAGLLPVPLLGVSSAGWGVAAGSALVCGAGLIDDLYPIGPRGLRSHLRSLLEGHMTTGILKLLTIVACSAIVVALQPVRDGWVRLLGVALIAASANVWNGLDVRPGRALKAFVPVALAVVWSVEWDLIPTLVGIALALPVALGLDLREWAMLGDAGANLVGFTAGVALFVALPDRGVAIAAATAVGLNVLAETVTFSSVIEGVPVLRWLDGLGRARPEG